MFLSIVFLILASPFYLAYSQDSSVEPHWSKSVQSYTWSNDDSVATSIQYRDGSLARLIFSTKVSDQNSREGHGCGFVRFSKNDSFRFAVVALQDIGTCAAEGIPCATWHVDKEIREKGKLNLEHDGNLFLQDPDGSLVWETNTTRKPITGIRLQEDGVLQVYSKDHVVWQSSGSPSSPWVSEDPSQQERVQKPAASSHLAAIISGSVAVTASVFVLFSLSVLFLRKQRKKQYRNEREEIEDYLKQVQASPRRFSYQEILSATGGFKLKLGGGGFGSVFKGILEDGTQVAVKRPNSSRQGMKEFLAEVKLISTIHHFNIVNLIGFCVERSRQFLIYEYMSNGSLDNWIFNHINGSVLDWKTRKKIMLDVAKGLAYLHEDCRQQIFHLDVKPQNILLDENFNAKVSDFGMSKLMDRDESKVHPRLRENICDHVPERELLSITCKVDTYSFGMLVLEVVSGRKSLDRSKLESSSFLLALLQQKAKENRLFDILNLSSAEMRCNLEDAMKTIRLAVWCLQDDHKRRPLMSVVVKVLEGEMEIEQDISYSFCNAMGPAYDAGSGWGVVGQTSEGSCLLGPKIG